MSATELNHLFKKRVSPLGDHLGCKDKAHVRAFTSAGRAALRDPKLQCHATTKTAPHCRCKRPAVKGAQLCIGHISMAQILKLDVERRARFEHIAKTSTWAAQRAVARQRLEAIERRNLKHVWNRIDPNAPGSLVRFASEADEARCVVWLKQQGLDPWGYWPQTDNRITYAARDQLMWSAVKFCIKKNITIEKALQKIEWARRFDARYYEKIRRADAGEVVDRRRRKKKVEAE